MTAPRRRDDSSSPAQPISLRARYVFPIDRPPIADGVVTIDRGRIVAVGPHGSGEGLSGEWPAPRDLGNVALLPGLVNAHTHLEFSDLARPLGAQGMSLPAWLAEVLATRGRQSDHAAAIEAGLAESLAAGVTAIGEIATQAWSPAVGPTAALAPRARLTIFRELIGLSSERIDAALSNAAAHLAGGDRRYAQDQQHSPSILLQPGLSPHAPYTVHPRLLADALTMAREHRCPVAMHVAESREEIELLATGAGPMATLLQARGVWQPGMFGGRNVREIIAALSTAPRALVIHGNYLADDDIALLAQHAATMSVVYCPRTHAYFGHDRYPLAKMLAAGVAIAIGTDSRASNPDLSILQELRFIARRHADVAPARVLELGTLAGARALGWDQEIGSLAVGKRADLCVVPLPDRNARDPHELLFDSDLGASETWIDGQPVQVR